MIELRNLTTGFGKRVLLQQVSTQFETGKLTALIGRNGTGKSTLLRIICGISENYEGDVLIEGKDCRSLSNRERACLISFVNTQRPRIANLSCRDIVALGRSPFTDWIGKLTDKDNCEIDKALELVGMESYADRSLNTLSDGECQRVMIARAIAQNTKAIILDEPTSFLDMPTRYEVVSLMKTLAHDENKTIIYSTHELDIAVEMSDNIALIDDRHLINYGVTEMIESGRIQKMFKMPGNYIERLLEIMLQSRK